MPDEAFTWVLGVEKAPNVDALEGPGLFPTLDMKLNVAITGIVSGTELGRLIRVQEEQYAIKRSKRFSGRQMLFEVYKHFRINAHD